MVEIDTLFQTKGITPPPPPPGAKNALQIMSLAAYASETN